MTKQRIYQARTKKLTFYLKQDDEVYPGLASATITITIVKSSDHAVSVVAAAAVVVEDAATGELSYLPATAAVFADQQLNLAQLKITIGGVYDHSDAWEIDVQEKL